MEVTVVPTSFTSAIVEVPAAGDIVLAASERLPWKARMRFFAVGTGFLRFDSSVARPRCLRPASAGFQAAAELALSFDDAFGGHLSRRTDCLLVEVARIFRKAPEHHGGRADNKNRRDLREHHVALLWGLCSRDVLSRAARRQAPAAAARADRNDRTRDQAPPTGGCWSRACLQQALHLRPVMGPDAPARPWPLHPRAPLRPRWGNGEDRTGSYRRPFNPPSPLPPPSPPPRHPPPRGSGPSPPASPHASG